MDNIWIVLVVLSAILIAISNKRVNKAEHPNAYLSKKKKPKKIKPVRENRMLEFSMAGLFVGIVLSTLMADKLALCISACFFVGLVLGMIFRKKTYVESLDELDIEEDAVTEAPKSEVSYEQVANEITTV